MSTSSSSNGRSVLLGSDTIRGGVGLTNHHQPSSNIINNNIPFDNSPQNPHNNQIIMRVSPLPPANPSSTSTSSSSTLSPTTRCLIVQKDEKGFGLKVSGSNPVFVAEVKAGGAAEKAGVLKGDRIIKVNGNLVTKADHESVVQMIRGPYVALTVMSCPATAASGALPSGSVASGNNINKNNGSSSGVISTTSSSSHNNNPFSSSSMVSIMGHHQPVPSGPPPPYHTVIQSQNMMNPILPPKIMLQKSANQIHPMNHDVVMSCHPKEFHNKSSFDRNIMSQEVQQTTYPFHHQLSSVEQQDVPPPLPPPNPGMIRMRDHLMMGTSGGGHPAPSGPQNILPLHLLQTNSKDDASLKSSNNNSNRASLLQKAKSGIISRSTSSSGATSGTSFGVSGGSSSILSSFPSFSSGTSSGTTKSKSAKLIRQSAAADLKSQKSGGRNPFLRNKNKNKLLIGSLLMSSSSSTSHLLMDGTHLKSSLSSTSSSSSSSSSSSESLSGSFDDSDQDSRGGAGDVDMGYHEGVTGTAGHDQETSSSKLLSQENPGFEASGEELLLKPGTIASDVLSAPTEDQDDAKGTGGHQLLVNISGSKKVSSDPKLLKPILTPSTAGSDEEDSSSTDSEEEEEDEYFLAPEFETIKLSKKEFEVRDLIQKVKEIQSSFGSESARGEQEEKRDQGVTHNRRRRHHHNDHLSESRTCLLSESVSVQDDEDHDNRQQEQKDQEEKRFHGTGISDSMDQSGVGSPSLESGPTGDTNPNSPQEKLLHSPTRVASVTTGNTNLHQPLMTHSPSEKGRKGDSFFEPINNQSLIQSLAESNHKMCSSKRRMMLMMGGGASGTGSRRSSIRSNLSNASMMMKPGFPVLGASGGGDISTTTTASSSGTTRGSLRSKSDPFNLNFRPEKPTADTIQVSDQSMMGAGGAGGSSTTGTIAEVSSSQESSTSQEQKSTAAGVKTSQAEPETRVKQTGNNPRKQKPKSFSDARLRQKQASGQGQHASASGGHDSLWLLSHGMTKEQKVKRKMKLKLRKLKMKELISSEKSFGRNLRLLNDLFYEPLVYLNHHVSYNQSAISGSKAISSPTLTSASATNLIQNSIQLSELHSGGAASSISPQPTSSSGVVSSSSILSPAEIEILFGNHLRLIEIHEILYQLLKERISPLIKSKLVKTSKIDYNLIGQNLREIFSLIGPKMEKEFAVFCSLAPGQNALIKSKSKSKNSKFSAFLSEAESTPALNRLKLKDLLAAPFQRIMRYPLLIQEVIHTFDSSGGGTARGAPSLSASSSFSRDQHQKTRVMSEEKSLEEDQKTEAVKFESRQEEPVIIGATGGADPIPDYNATSDGQREEPPPHPTGQKNKLLLMIEREESEAKSFLMNALIETKKIVSGVNRRKSESEFLLWFNGTFIQPIVTSPQFSSRYSNQQQQNPITQIKQMNQIRLIHSGVVLWKITPAKSIPIHLILLEDLILFLLHPAVASGASGANSASISSSGGAIPSSSSSGLNISSPIINHHHPTNPFLNMFSAGGTDPQTTTSSTIVNSNPFMVTSSNHSNHPVSCELRSIESSSFSSLAKLLNYNQQHNSHQQQQQPQYQQQMNTTTTKSSSSSPSSVVVSSSSCSANDSNFANNLMQGPTNGPASFPPLDQLNGSCPILPVTTELETRVIAINRSAFFLFSKDAKHASMYELVTPSLEDCKRWINSINSAVEYKKSCCTNDYLSADPLLSPIDPN